MVIFILPRYVPVRPTYSDSYLFGYNNRAGVLLLLAGLVLAGMFSGRLGLTFPERGSAAAVSRAAKRNWTLVVFAACVGLWLLVRGFGGWGESRYMIDRLEALASGQVPYRDFEFAYGPLLMYGPRLLMLTGLSAVDAYYLFWTGCSVAGVWMLAAVIDRLEIPGAQRTTVFHLFCWPLLVNASSAGTNDAAIRFLTPIWAALVTARMAERGDGRVLRVAGAAAGSTAACLLLSPEMGMAFAAGMIAWLIFELARCGELFTARSAASVAAVGAAEAILLLFAARLGEFATLNQFAAGAFSYPILPAGYILVFFFGCGLVAVYLAWCLRRGCADTGVLLAAAVSAPMVMSALGRCAPGHVLMNGIGVLLIATLLASALPRVWQPWCAAFLLFLLLAPTAAGMLTYIPPLQGAFADRKAGVRLSSVVEPARIFPGVQGVVEAPFGYIPLGLGSWRSPSIDTGYYFIVINAFSPADTERKIAELRRHPERPLLLPEDWGTFCRIDLSKETLNMELVLELPWYGTPRHEADIWRPLCDFIRSHYRPAARSTLAPVRYVLWMPAGGDAALSARARERDGRMLGGGKVGEQRADFGEDFLGL